MRTLVSLLLLSSSALAEPSPAAPAPTEPSNSPAVNLAPILLAEIPEPCHPIAKQAGAASLHQALSARISLAGCVADHKLAPLVLCDCASSVLDVDVATRQSVELLDDVIAAGDPTIKIMAEHARAELYSSMAVRMMSTIPAPAATTDSLALRDSRKAILEIQLRPWREQANASDRRVVELATASPQLAKNPVVKTAVASSKRRLAAKLAER